MRKGYRHINARGFTLIELLVVIAIIGVLASIILASLNTARIKARDTRRIADIKSIRTALELYFDKNATYPVGTEADADYADLITQGFISAIPQDPFATAYLYKSLSADEVGTVSDCTASPCNHYHLGANVEMDGTGAGGTGGADVLGHDYDLNTGFTDDFPGLSADCATAGSDDGCYDMVPL